VDLMLHGFGPVEQVYARIALFDRIRKGMRRQGGDGPSAIYAVTNAGMPDEIEPDVEDSAMATLRFQSGALGQWTLSHAGHGQGFGKKSYYGSKGSLRCIDPNNFGGQLYLRKADSSELTPVENQFGYTGNSRGVGVADMVTAIRSGRPHRASGEMAYHVVDTITAMHEASAENRHITLQSTCQRPAPLPLGLADWGIDD
jgi:predicted dehydrogenase